MISRARDIQKQLNHIINLDDIDFISTLTKLNSDIQDIASRLVTIFDDDNKVLKQKSSRKGLNSRYSRIEKDVAHRIGQAFLHAEEIKRNRNEQFICVVSRLIICRKVAVSHLKKMVRLIAELGQGEGISNTGLLKNGEIKKLLKIGRNIDQIRGYGREAYLIVDDYCHFYDLANHLLGDKAELYGRRFKADVYNFQLDSAIRELFTSRTESCDAAPFLLRSYLELKIRRSIFRAEFMKPKRYIPTKKLSISELLKSCRRNGIHFNYPNEIIELLLENLNLVIHFGFKLNSALLWYIYFVTNSMQFKYEDSVPIKEREKKFKENAMNVINDLETRKLIQNAEDTDYYKKPGINIFWRY
jgi:hypothetical protein